MATTPNQDRRLAALTAALARNRGELDPARLQRLLQLIETLSAPKTAAA